MWGKTAKQESAKPQYLPVAIGGPKARVTTETGNVAAGCLGVDWGNFMVTEARIHAQSALLCYRRRLLPDRRWVMTNISTSAGFCFRCIIKDTSPFFWFRVLFYWSWQQSYKKKPQTDRLLRASVVSSDSTEARVGEGVIREIVVHWNSCICSRTWQPVRFCAFFLLTLFCLTSSWFFFFLSMRHTFQ